jgi:hypothetical protein
VFEKRIFEYGREKTMEGWTELYIAEFHNVSPSTNFVRVKNTRVHDWLGMYHA